MKADRIAPAALTDLAARADTSSAALIVIGAEMNIPDQAKLATSLALARGVQHVFVAVDHMDRVGYDYDVFKTQCAHFKAVVAPLVPSDLRFFPVSSRRGDNLYERGNSIDWYDGPTLIEAISNLAPKAARSPADRTETIE